VCSSSTQVIARVVTAAADIAVRASLTGHLVFSTLHTTDTTSAVARLVDMGVEPFLLASSLQAVLAQRLVRLVCSVCHGLDSACEPCLGTGYRGRTGLFELLVLNDDLRERIQKNEPASVLRKAAVAGGLRTLFQDGQQKVSAGVTTESEILRVTEDV
jgi:type II secretory ATPase GspE/PulE/Tfp pilus assembly ATPase PilB-like protein